MKKIILLLTAAAVITSAVPSMATDITLGATTWYSWWDSTFSNNPDSIEFDPAFLYGPVLAVKFNDEIGLNAVFLFGKFEGDYDHTGAKTPAKSDRYDSDTSISYALNGNFKIFAGFKYSGYKITTDIIPAYLTSLKVETKAYGPAAGLSCIYPLADNFFILANGSLIYQWGKSYNSFTMKTDAVSYGYNTTASIAYYIPSSSVTLSLGGRYQYYKWVVDDDSSMDSTHKFYGATASATYSFNL